MADVKPSGLPTKSAPTGSDYVILNDATGPTTKRTFLSALATWFFNQLNIPSGSGSPVTRDSELHRPCVISGLVWSGDAYASTRNASMTAGVVYINGRRLSVSAVTARVFLASVDTYIDVLDNQDGTATLVYSTVANNAASPTLAANSIRIGIVVTGATNIAAAASINQGSPWATLPTTGTSPTCPIAVCDTIGNLIYPSPNQKLLGVRVYPTGPGPSTTSTSPVSLGSAMHIPVLAANVPGRGRIAANLTGRVFNSSSGSPDVGHCFGTLSVSTFFSDASGGTSLVPLNARGVQQVTADTTIIPYFLTSAGTGAIQAYNNSLVNWVEVD